MQKITDFIVFRLLDFTYQVPFITMFKIVLAIALIGFLARKDTIISAIIPEKIKDYVFVILGAIGFIYVAIIGTFADCMLFFVMWFFGVCIAGIADTAIEDF